MTENEAKLQLKAMQICLNHYSEVSCNDCINCEKCKDADFTETTDELWEETVKVILDSLEEREAYRAIGTIDECRVAVEKMKPKKAIHIKKHLWEKDEDGEVDIFAYSSGYCNGPRCEVCGDYFCMHCTPHYQDKECSIGYYECECGGVVEKGDKFCKHCGCEITDWSN